MSSLVNKMANLLCAERTEQPRGIEDPVLGHPEVGANLVSLQYTTVPPFDYFPYQPHILPYMRKVVANWMHSVCEEQKCEDTVFPLAMNYFDRFLCTTVVIKTQLQLVGSVCLLLSTKMRQYTCFSLALLSEYTENSISPEEIQQWELVVIEKLGWDLSPAIPNDFVDHVLVRCGIPLSKTSTVRKHALTLVALTVMDNVSIPMPPSLIAAGSIGMAARSLGYLFASDMMAALIEDDALYVEQAIAYVHRLVEESATSDATAIPDSPQSPVTSPVPEEYMPPVKYLTAEDVDETYFDGNETPTDVTDIKF